MFATENLKTALAFAIGFGTKLEEALLNDGVVTTKELLGFIPTLTKIPALIKSISFLKDEFTDLTEEERLELNTWLVTTLDLNNDVVEEYIETAFAFLVALSELVQVKPAV